MTQNCLCIDLSRYSDDLFGSSSGAASSLIVQVTFALGSTSDPTATSTQYRSLPF
jgi:hypothetical protein